MSVLGRVGIVLLSPNRALRKHVISVGAIALLLGYSVREGRGAPVFDQAARVSTAGAPAGEGWAPFQSQRGHFQVDQPATWTATEHVDREGSLVTTFTAPTGAAISVVVQSETPARPDDSDVMNTRCRAVTVGGRVARSCLDTISSALVTTVVGDSRTYRIIGNRRRVDQRIYDRLLSSFRMLP